MSTVPPDSADDARRLDLEAAAWLVKHDRGFTAADQDDFFQWLAADPRHGEWIARHRQSWRALDQLAQWRPEHSTEPNPDLLARLPPRRVARTRIDWRWPALFAAAAAVIIAVRLSWPERERPSIAAWSVAANYERRALDDGSIVELNRGAAIDVNFTAGVRHVTLLQGEATFTVAKNPLRPFLVHAGGIDVRAVGTAFNVRMDAARVEVLVTEGKVHLGPTESALASTSSTVTKPNSSRDGAANRAGPPSPGPVTPTIALVAGQRAIVPLANGAKPQFAHLSPEEISRALAWQPQLLDFSAAPLRRVVDEFNRRNRVQIVLADPELGEVPIVASIRSDNVEGLVRLLVSAAGVHAEDRGADVIVLHAPK